MFTAQVKQTNPGWDKALLKLLPQLASRQIAVGFPKGRADLSQPHPGYEGGMSIIDGAAANEFGTERQPRRPFLHQSRDPLEKMFRQAQDSLATAAKKAIESGQSGKINLTPALAKIALNAEGIVKDTIINGSYKENAEKTIRRKQKGKPGIKTRPLIDSGDMHKYVTGVVREASQ